MNMTILTFLFSVSPIENLKNFILVFWRKFSNKKILFLIHNYICMNIVVLYFTIFTFQTKHKEPFGPRIELLLIIQYLKEYSQNLDLQI